MNPNLRYSRLQSALLFSLLVGYAAPIHFQNRNLAQSHELRSVASIVTAIRFGPILFVYVSGRTIKMVEIVRVCCCCSHGNTEEEASFEMAGRVPKRNRSQLGEFSSRGCWLEHTRAVDQTSSMSKKFEPCKDVCCAYLRRDSSHATLPANTSEAYSASAQHTAAVLRRSVRMPGPDNAHACITERCLLYWVCTSATSTVDSRFLDTTGQCTACTTL